LSERIDSRRILLVQAIVSFGPLGILGRNGWFCREADVERWNALAGWRGLKDPAVRDAFNATFLAFQRDWGNNALMLSNLGLRYDVVYLGSSRAPSVIQSTLDAGIPAFFYLWSPHPFHALYRLNRIQLPAYSAALFEVGLSDFPIDVVVKMGTKQLAMSVPEVAEMYSRFRIDNTAQESMLAMINADGTSVMQAVCIWMRKEENAAVWKAWLPTDEKDKAITSSPAALVYSKSVVRSRETPLGNVVAGSSLIFLAAR
jgi:ABC-type proline/glycine betaine transport system substrate-binding protein